MNGKKAKQLRRQAQKVAFNHKVNDVLKERQIYRAIKQDCNDGIRDNKGNLIRRDNANIQL